MNEWEGKFGDDYTKRNTPDVGVRYKVFGSILWGMNPYSIVEIGCNKGVNLFALKIIYPKSEICGVEINKKILDAGIPPFFITKSIKSFRDKTVDLVFTCGVLIHIPSKDLKRMMEEIINASYKYVLAIEYYAPKETEVIYRGLRNMLWKRDYGKLYKDLGLKLISTGEVPEIDNSTYWLFKK